MRPILALFLVLVPAVAAADTEVRQTPAFHGVCNSAVLDIDIAVGSTPRVELSGPKDWLGKITTKVDADGVLEFTMPDQVRNPPKLHATITVPSLDILRVKGVGNMTVTKLAAKALAVTLSGVGEITLNGGAEDLDLKLSGVGDIRARELSAKTAVVKVSGTGDAQVRASKEVTATVSGMGDITIAGKPGTVTKKVSGMGDIHVE